MPAECVGPEALALLLIINSYVSRLVGVSENSINNYGGMCLHTQSYMPHELHIYGTHVTRKGRPSSDESTIPGENLPYKFHTTTMKNMWCLGVM